MQDYREAQENSKHFGEVGKRGDFELTITYMREFENEYGISTLVKFLDAIGNVAVWWASGSPRWIQQGNTVHVKATVKEHSQYNGILQTAITRVKPSDDTGIPCCCAEYNQWGSPSESCPIPSHQKAAKVHAEEMRKEYNERQNRIAIENGWAQPDAVPF